MATVLSDFVINDDDDVGIMGDLNFPYANQNLPEHHVEDIDFGLVVDSDTDSAFDSGSFKRRDDLEDAAVENVQIRSRLSRSASVVSRYNEPKSVDVLDKVNTSEGGLTWHATIYRDINSVNKKHLTKDGTLKPRRPLPHVLAADFFDSIVKTSDGRYMFSGILNGWPALREMEVISITCSVKSLLGRVLIKRTWNKGQSQGEPAYPKDKRIRSVRATLRAPLWTKYGWSKDSHGRAFYYTPFRKFTPKMSFGTNMLDDLQREFAGVEAGQPKMPQAVRAHMIAHRYSVAKENIKDMFTYHALVLVEWDHGKYTTIFELAWLNGLGGYGGKSNWIDDRVSAHTFDFPLFL